MKLIARLCLLTLMSLVPMLASAASFDCTKASHRVEFLVCGSLQASALDEQLAASYRRALHRATDAVALRQQQRWWLTQVRNTCPDERCVVEVYTARIHSLDGTTPAAAVRPPVDASRASAVAATGSTPSAPASTPARVTSERQGAAAATAPPAEVSRVAQGASALLWTALIVLGVLLLAIAFWLATMVAVIMMIVTGVVVMVVVLL